MVLGRVIEMVVLFVVMGGGGCADGSSWGCGGH